MAGLLSCRIRAAVAPHATYQTEYALAACRGDKSNFTGEILPAAGCGRLSARLSISVLVSRCRDAFASSDNNRGAELPQKRRLSARSL
eukprot:2432755-Prymnesium_polylepis.1